MEKDEKRIALENEVIALVSKVLEKEAGEVTLTSNFSADLDVESLDLVDLIVAFEDKYGFEIPDNDAKAIQTVNDLVNYIVDRQKEVK